MSERLFIVIPCYYDEEVLPVTAPIVLQKVLELIDADLIDAQSRIVFVNDGSLDCTWNVIQNLHKDYVIVSGVNLVENVGEQNALLAGMEFSVSAGADFVITMDSDLQDDIQAVNEMIEYYYKGNDLVLGVRSSRKQDSVSERFFSGAFYLLMRVFRTGLVNEHANYRLMSRKAITELLKRAHGRFYLPALVCSIDLPRAVVLHTRFPRAAGESGYNFLKKSKLALTAIFWHANIPGISLFRTDAESQGTIPLYKIKEILS